MQVSDYKKGDKPLINSVLNKIDLLNAMNDEDNWFIFVLFKIKNHLNKNI